MKAFLLMVSFIVMSFLIAAAFGPTIRNAAYHYSVVKSDLTDAGITLEVK